MRGSGTKKLLKVSDLSRNYLVLSFFRSLLFNVNSESPVEGQTGKFLFYHQSIELIDLAFETISHTVE